MNQKLICKIVETSSVEEANQYLLDGWILLSAGFMQFEEPGRSSHSYSLGYPTAKDALDKIANDF